MCLCSPNTAREASPADCLSPGLRGDLFITRGRIDGLPSRHPGCGDGVKERATGARGRGSMQSARVPAHGVPLDVDPFSVSVCSSTIRVLFRAEDYYAKMKIWMF